MTIDEIKEKIPPEFHDWLDVYGEPLLRVLAADAIENLKKMLTDGDVEAAYTLVVEGMTPEEKIVEAEYVADHLDDGLNPANAEKMVTQKIAAEDFAKTLFSFLLTLVSLL